MDDPQEVIIVDASGQEHIFPPGFNPRHAAAIVKNGGSAALPTKPASAEQFMDPKDIENRDMTAMDVVKGAAKGVGRSALGVADLASQSRMFPGLSESLATARPTLDAYTQNTNDAQRLGGVIENVAEIGLPVLKGARAIPTRAKAGAMLQDVMGAARQVPINTQATGDAALRVQQLADRGGSMPMSVRKLLNRMTDPNQPPLAFEEAKDFYSNISRLSADEFQRLTPVVQRQVGELRSVFNNALGDAAETVGKGREYATGMKDYARASKIRDVVGDVAQGAKRALPYAGGAGAGYLLMQQLLKGITP